MHSMRIFCLCLLLPAACTSQPASEVQGDAVFFEGARLITGDGSAPIEGSAFLVENGRFTQIGTQGELEPPPGAARVDLTGKTVMPGMIDAHTHIGYEDYRTENPSLAEPNVTRENILDQLQRLAYSGVVATQSLGYDYGDLFYQIRDETAAGQIPNAARFLPSGPGIATKDTLRDDNGRLHACGVETPEEGRACIEELSTHHVPLAKLWVVQGTGPNDRFGSKVVMSPEVYQAVIDEAHKRDMRVVAHTTGANFGSMTPDLAEHAKGVVRAGVDGLAHAVVPDDELLGLIKERGPQFFIISTTGGGSQDWQADPPALLRDIISPTQLKQLQDRRAAARAEETPESLEQARQRNEDRTRYWQQFKAAGVRIAFASDAHGFPGLGIGAHLELEDLVANGFTPLEAITAATQTSAEALQLHDLGTIAAGKSADFIVLDANPLEDITNTRQVNQVYMRGTEVDRAALRSELNRWWSGQTTN